MIRSAFIAPLMIAALRGLALRSRGAASVGVLRTRAGDGFRQGQRGLGGRLSSQPKHGQEEVDRSASYHLFNRIHEAANGDKRRVADA